MLRGNPDTDTDADAETDAEADMLTPHGSTELLMHHPLSSLYTTEYSGMHPTVGNGSWVPSDRGYHGRSYCVVIIP